MARLAREPVRGTRGRYETARMANGARLRMHGRGEDESIISHVRTAAKLWGERDKSKVAAQYGNYSDVLDYFENASFEEIYEDLGIFGTPDQVAEKIRWMRDEGGVDNVMNFMWFGGIDHEKATRNVELFAREVMPQFQEIPVGEASHA